MTKLLLGLGILIVAGAAFGAFLTFWTRLFPADEQDGQEEAGAAEEQERYLAVVHCTGGGASFSKYNYQGVKDCLAAAQLPGGGPLSCDYGCLGMGSCVKACPSGAIHVQNGFAVVDRERCMACGACLDACPRRLISLEPFRPQRHVSIPCASKAQGEIVTEICTDGCIGCALCMKTCPKEAITLEEGLARIDYEICDNCGLCASKCPRHLIWVEKVTEPPKPEPPKPLKEKKPQKPKEKKEKERKMPKWKVSQKPEKEEKKEKPSVRPPQIEPEPIAVPVLEEKVEPVAKPEEKPTDSSKTSAEAFKAFEQAVAAVDVVLGEKETEAPQEVSAAAQGETKTE